MFKEERMVLLTKLNGKEFFVNPHQIEFMESVPETLLTLLSGKTMYVKETIEQVVNKIIEYRKRIGIFKNEL